MSLWFALCSLALAGASEAPRRHAVVVGANDGGVDRTELRYAHTDAERFRDTLVEVGDFASEDVDLLLNPDPDELLAALDQALDEAADDPQAMLVFYYSGHADADALFTDGQALALADLRARIEDERADVRIGIIDACSGGGWTGTKGLVAEAEPFFVPADLPLSSSGSVLIASSSGIENAHETDVTRGSLFTHHLVTGLRGAADASGDGRVSLNEVYGYAKDGTVRDAVLYAKGTQHPSFHLDLRGQQDLVLTRVDAADSWVELQQARGPLDLIDLSSGVTLLELPEGARDVRLALPPGDYLVRRTEGEAQHAHEFALAPGETLRIAEDQLVLVADSALLATKGTVERRDAVGPVSRGRTWYRLNTLASPFSDQPHLGVTLGTMPQRLSEGAGPFTQEISVVAPVGERVDLLLPGVLRYHIGRSALWGGVQAVGFATYLGPLDGMSPQDLYGMRLTLAVSLGVDGRIPTKNQPIEGVRYVEFGAYATTLGHDFDELNAGLDDLNAVAHVGWCVQWRRWAVAFPFALGLRIDGDAEGNFGEPRVALGMGSQVLSRGVRRPLVSFLLHEQSGASIDLFSGSDFAFGESLNASEFVGLGVTFDRERTRAR